MGKLKLEVGGLPPLEMQDFYREQDEIRKAAPEAIRVRKAAEEAQAARIREEWAAEQDAKGISDWKVCVSRASAEGIEVRDMPPCPTAATELSQAAKKIIGFDVTLVCGRNHMGAADRCHIIVGGQQTPL